MEHWKGEYELGTSRPRGGCSGNNRESFFIWREMNFQWVRLGFKGDKWSLPGVRVCFALTSGGGNFWLYLVPIRTAGCGEAWLLLWSWILGWSLHPFHLHLEPVWAGLLSTVPLPLLWEEFTDYPTEFVEYNKHLAECQHWQKSSPLPAHVWLSTFSNSCPLQECGPLKSCKGKKVSVILLYLLSAQKGCDPACGSSSSLLSVRSFLGSGRDGLRPMKRRCS